MKIGFAKVEYNNKILYGIIDFYKNCIKTINNSYFENYEFDGNTIEFKKNNIKFLPPTSPTKIVCLGLNYKDHAEELKMPIPSEPIIFIKPPSSIIGDKDNIIYPPNVQQLDYEAELAVVIKSKCKNVKETEVDKYILGYTCFNDVTARDLQRKDGQWTRSKSFDTFAPIGPYIVSGIDVSNLNIQAILNDKIVQNSTTANMIFSIEYVISFVSHIMTLYPGDVISLGTPVGVGPMQPGDKIVVKIESIGELTNYVV